MTTIKKQKRTFKNAFLPTSSRNRNDEVVSLCQTQFNWVNTEY